jgi:peptidoglycan hydrolase-like protein with peptidoglycan-binding domain
LTKALKGALRLLCVAVLVAAVLAGCGSDDDDGGTGPSGGGAGQQTEREGPTGEQGGTPDDPSTVELYFTEGEQLATVERARAKVGSPEEAVEALLAGPADPEVDTQIPPAAEVQDVAVEQGEAIVRVSDEFLAGIPEAPAQRSPEQRQELNARLAQVTYTVSEFGGGGLEVKVVAGGDVVEPPQARQDFAAPDRPPRRVKRAPEKGVSGTRRIQERLADIGYLPRGAVDGIYGYRTEQAVMALQAWEGIDRDGVVGPQTRGVLADARRPRPRRSRAPRRIEVYRDKGVALLIRKDRTVRAIHVATGGPGTETPSGTYRVFRKELQSWSVPFSVWLPYASYFNNGIAFHEYPDVPPYPASHGCVRVPAPEAKGVYEFARINTVVKVF